MEIKFDLKRPPPIISSKASHLQSEPIDIPQATDATTLSIIFHGDLYRMLVHKKMKEQTKNDL